jgi:hypothetical protein
MESEVVKDKEGLLMLLSQPDITFRPHWGRALRVAL